MININDNWNWNLGKKNVDISFWPISPLNINRLQVSPDGERLILITEDVNGSQKIYDTEKLWDKESFEKIWNLKFAKDRVSYACVLTQDGWTISVDDIPWNNNYDYIWNLMHKTNNISRSLSLVGAVQDKMQYFMVLNQIPWPEKFDTLTYSTLSPNGLRTAAVVQIDPHISGEVHKFKRNIFTIAVDGIPWSKKFLNAWNIFFDPSSQHVAAEVRLDLDKYTIAVNNSTWSETYECVWHPVFHPIKKSVAAPIRIGNRWGLAVDGCIIWDAKFYQLWHQQYDISGNKLVAIVSPKYGYWTVAVNQVLWKTLVDTAITDLTFSRDGEKLLALAKHKNYWYLIVDDCICNNKFDMIWPPVISNNGVNIATKVEINGKHTFLINNSIYKESFDKVWNPQFNYRGNKLLLRSIKQGIYQRHVIKVK